MSLRPGRSPLPASTPFGAELARLGWTQAQAAAFLQVSRSTVQNWCRGVYAPGHAVLLVLRAVDPDQPAARAME